MLDDSFNAVSYPSSAPLNTSKDAFSADDARPSASKLISSGLSLSEPEKHAFASACTCFKKPKSSSTRSGLTENFLILSFFMV